MSASERVLVKTSMQYELRWTKKHNRDLLRAIRKEENLRKRLVAERDRQHNLEAVLAQLREESKAVYKEPLTKDKF